MNYTDSRKYWQIANFMQKKRSSRAIKKLTAIKNTFRIIFLLKINIMNNIYFWRDIYGDISKFEPYMDIIYRLFHGNRHGLHFERLHQRGPLPIYSVRVNDTKRLLFTSYQGSLCLLDVVLNHDYEKNPFLRHSKKAMAFIQGLNDSNKIESIPAEPDLPASLETPTFYPLDYVQGQFIQLSINQETVLHTPIPAIISGPAGSGKTSTALTLLSQKVQTAEGPIAYISRSPHLVDTMRTMWKEAYPEDSILDFKTYDQLYSTQDDAFFQTWLNKQRIAGAGMDLNPELIWRELRIRSGYDTPRQYLELGHRQSLIEPSERPIINELYERYLAQLEHESTSLSSSSRTLPYSLAVVDEAQDLSHAQLKNLYLGSRAQIIYLLGSHQIIYDGISKIDFIRQLLRENGKPEHIISLPISYRSGEKVLDLTNALIHLKASVTGASDKLETKMTVAETLKDQGQFELRNTSAIEDLIAQGPHLAVITLEHLKAEARERFKTPLVFSIAEIKGLEFHTVVLWKLLTDDKAKAFNRLIPASADLDKTLHRAKAGQDHREHIPTCDAWITAASRAQQRLIWVDNLNHSNNLIYQHLSCHITSGEIHIADLPQSSWRDIYEQLIAHQAHEQALQIDLTHARLENPIDIEASTSIDEPTPLDFEEEYQVLQKYSHSKKNSDLEAKIKKIAYDCSSKKLAAKLMNFLLLQENGGDIVKRLKHKNCYLFEELFPTSILFQNTISDQTPLGRLIYQKEPSLLIAMLEETPTHKLPIRAFDPTQTSSLFHCLIETVKGREILAKLFHRTPGGLIYFESRTPLDPDYCHLITLLVEFATKQPENELARCLKPLKLTFTHNSKLLFKFIAENAYRKQDTWTLELLRLWGFSWDDIFLEWEKALIVAIRDGKIKLIDFFCQQGIDKNMNLKHYGCILHIACLAHQLPVVQYLCQSEASPDITMRNQFTPLHISAREGSLDIIKCLLKAGASINKENKFGETPLHIAAKFGHLNCVKFLIQQGANTEKKDALLGLTPGQTATKYGHYAISKYLSQQMKKSSQTDASSTQNNFFTPKLLPPKPLLQNHGLITSLFNSIPLTQYQLCRHTCLFLCLCALGLALTLKIELYGPKPLY